MLRTLDISNTQLESAAIAAALGKNSSIRSIDMRAVPKMSECFESIGSMLLAPNSQSRLAYVRCDSLEILEGVTTLNLRERYINKGTMHLLTGLLKNNREVQELDLGATSIQKDWAMTLLDTLAACSSTINSLHLPYNPLVVEAEIAKLVEEKNLKISLHF